MIFDSWRTCRLAYDDSCAVIENDVMCTRWVLGRAGLALTSIENKVSGYCWCTAQNAPAPAPHCMALPGAAASWHTAVCDDGLSDAHWIIEFTLKAENRCVCRRFALYEGSPFLTMSAEWQGIGSEAFAGCETDDALPSGIERDEQAQNGCSEVYGDIMAAVPVPATHLRWESVRLFDQTDSRDTLVSRESALSYPRETTQSSGSIFALHAQLSGETLFALRLAPVTPSGGVHFSLHGDTLLICQNGCAGTLPESAAGCSCAIGAVRSTDAWESFRDFYRCGWRAPWQEHSLIVSNTWGDRSRDSRICESFIMNEIDCAARLGLDAVQIDDGWQTGTTVNSANPQNGVWEGYYAACRDFWQPNPTRFPNGFEPVVAYAAKRGIALGLWFSPDSSDEFSGWQRDAETLLHLFRTYGICMFKLDGVKLRTPLARKRFTMFMREVLRESGGKICLQQDITAEQRLGYFPARECGTLFVENRYTDFHNYYPHRTLRNLWMLSRYIPSQRMLFELLNPRRCRNVYGDDPLGPDAYDADYLFAAAMPAQPLMWMELSGLADSDAARLEKIIAVYRSHRKAMWNCDVCPIGDEPDGFSFPGFLMTDRTGRREGFLLVFRENTEADAAVFRGLPKGCRLRLLCSNGTVRRLSGEEGCAALSFSAQRTYAFYRWTVPESNN